MSWFDRVLEAMQTAAVIGERVERVSNDVAEVAVELRELDRRVAQLEGAFAVLMSDSHRDGPPRLP
jgi:hypothetical protein